MLFDTFLGEERERERMYAGDVHGLAKMQF